MPQTHKVVLDSVLDVLRGSFNATLANTLPAYGISDTIELDFGPGNTTVVYARLESQAFNVSTLRGRLTLEIQPEGSQWTGESRGIKWSGIVGVRLVFRLRYSIRDEDDTPPDESVMFAAATAIEDAVIEVFQAYQGWPSSLIYAKPPECPEGYQVELLPDGGIIAVPMAVAFKIDAN